MVGDMGCVCPLPKGKVPCVGIALTSHLLSLASRTVTVGSRCLKARLYGWLPLSDAQRHLLCNRSNDIFFANCSNLIPLASSLCCGA